MIDAPESPRTSSHDRPRLRLARIGSGLLIASLAVWVDAGCRRDSSLPDVPPAPGDPYARQTTPPHKMPPGEDATDSRPEPPKRPAPTPPAQPQPPKPQQPKAPQPPAPAAPASPQPAPQPAPKPAPQPAPPAAAPAPVADEAGNRKKVDAFGKCRALCASQDVSDENMPTCKLACVNATASRDTYAENCKRGCLRDAHSCFSPCEEAASPYCRQGCEKSLLSCMNQCDLSQGQP